MGPTLYCIATTLAIQCYNIFLFLEKKVYPRLLHILYMYICWFALIYYFKCREICHCFSFCTGQGIRIWSVPLQSLSFLQFMLVKWLKVFHQYYIYISICLTYTFISGTCLSSTLCAVWTCTCMNDCCLFIYFNSTGWCYHWFVCQMKLSIDHCLVKLFVKTPVVLKVHRQLMKHNKHLYSMCFRVWFYYR